MYSGPTLFTTIDVPLPGVTSTYGISINDSGQVAGGYKDASGYSHGFVYSGGTNPTFTYLDDLIPGVTSISIANINNRGQVTGGYSNGSGGHGFVYSGPTSFTTIDVPLPGVTSTYGISINDSGQVAGGYYDATGGHGFVYSGGTNPTFTYLDVPLPGVTGTFGTSINDSGQVTGYYYDASGNHGFIATPIGTPFSAFNVTRLVIDQNRGALFLWSNFALGKDSNGINPVKEDVTLKVADFTMTIPAGSFHKDRYLPLFTFAGQIDNVWIEALIMPLGRNRFGFQALAYGAQLGDTKNPVPVELTIGNDGGTTTANASTH